MNNYSIMQLVQRLMLPHIPFSISTDDNVPEANKCNWSNLDQTCELLCAKMLEGTDVDTPPHISDLFITVMQLSPPEALILSHMSGQKALNSLLEAAIVDDADTASAIEIPSAKASTSLAALAVFEAIVSRLCETAASLTEMNDPDMKDDMKESIAELSSKIKNSVKRVTEALIPYLDKISAQLKGYVVESPCGTVAGQAKYAYPRLGHRGLHLVKVVEAVVRLSQPNLDELLCSSGIISNVINLIFVFDMNSILHLSVQRIVLMIVEGGAERKALQTHMLVECGLLKRIMHQLWATRCPQESEEYKGEATTKSPDTVFNTSSPCLGHLVNISQAINHIMQNEGSVEQKDRDDDEIDETTNVRASPEATGSQDTVPATGINGIMVEATVNNEWKNFKDHILRPLDGQSSSDVGEPDGDDGISAQMEMAMAALGFGQTDMENLKMFNNGGGDSPSGQFQYEDSNGNNRVHEMDEDDDNDDDEGDGDSSDEETPNANRKTQQETGAEDAGTADFADFDDAGFDAQLEVVAGQGLQGNKNSAADKTTSQKPVAVEDDFSFADFDSAPDDALNDAVAAANQKLMNVEGNDSDPFSDNNVDILESSNKTDMVQPPDDLSDPSELE